MISTIRNLSSCISPILSSGLAGMDFKKFSRTYPGGYSLNFSKCLSAYNDFKIKNYSNFYLTNKFKITDIFKVDQSPIKTTSIYGPLQVGTDYLTFFDIDARPYALNQRQLDHYNYGITGFSPQPWENTQFTLNFLDNSRCHIYFTKNYINFYLVVDADKQVVFVKEELLSFDNSAINPQDLIYQYYETSKELILFKKIESEHLSIVKTSNRLGTITITQGDTFSSTSTRFKILKNLYIYPNINPNMSQITYDMENSIDSSKSVFDLPNNYLLHNTYSTSEDTDVIILKNQLLQSDINPTTTMIYNSATSGEKYITPPDVLREYTTIGEDIPEECSENLELNYLFNNESYTITSGSNKIISPSSMYPFKHININDTTFINSGAFSNLNPKYADKVYQISEDVNNSQNGQYLLCTWLSGAPMSTNPIWVDRYYYPDLISKEEALVGNSIINYTYDDIIESLIQNNIYLKDSVESKYFFDTISNLVFEPTKEYRYDRIQIDTLPSLSSDFTYCNTYATNLPANYFKTINQSGELTISFNFKGDDSSWTVKSNRNEIDSGITITKNGAYLEFRVEIYDSVYENKEYVNSSEAWMRVISTSPLSLLKDNFITLSISTKTGLGYFYLNHIIVNSFKIPSYQFLTKSLIYGDFYILTNDQKYNLLSNEYTSIYNVFLTTTFTDPSLAFTIPFLNGTIKIDNICLSLPGGFRNSLDCIDLLQYTCGSATHKSNNINIHLKNLQISNTNILNGVKQSIITAIKNYLPTNTNINSITFDNFQ